MSPLLTQSGHEQLRVGAVQTDLSNPIPPIANPCCNTSLKIGVVLTLGWAMRRRSRASSKPAKARSRKAQKSKRRTAPKLRRRSSPAVAQETELARRTRERDEALERETATSVVLRLISQSPGDLELVFRSILENATRICDAKFGALILREGDRFRFVAFHNAPPAYVELRTREPYVRLIAGTALARAVATKQAAQIADVTKHQPTRADPLRRSFAALTGARTLITVPMLKDDQIVGAINIYRQE